MKIIFSGQVIDDICCREDLTVKSTLGRYLLDEDVVCFKLALSVLVISLNKGFVYLHTYGTTHLCRSIFKAIFWRWFSLMLKPFGVDVWRCLIHLSLCISIIAVISSNENKANFNSFKFQLNNFKGSTIVINVIFLLYSHLLRPRSAPRFTSRFYFLYSLLYSLRWDEKQTGSLLFLYTNTILFI